MTQAELASLMNSTNIQVSRYENGVIFPVVETIVRIAEVFEVSVDYLLGISSLRSPGVLVEADLLEDERRLIRATRDEDVKTSLLMLAIVLEQAQKRRNELTWQQIQIRRQRSSAEDEQDARPF